MASQEQVVEILFLAGFFEGENALDDDEDDNTDREEVDLSAVVDFAFLNFGSHVGHGSAVAPQLVNALVASKAEVGDFEVELIVDENVLELKITVNASEVMHVIE